MAGSERESPVGLSIPPFGKYPFISQFNLGSIKQSINGCDLFVRFSHTGARLNHDVV